MKPIVKIHHVQHTDNDDFLNDLNNIVEVNQDFNADIDIKYSTAISDDTVYYSALVLIRK